MGPSNLSTMNSKGRRVDFAMRAQACGIYLASFKSGVWRRVVNRITAGCCQARNTIPGAEGDLFRSLLN